MKLLRILAISALTLECMCAAPIPAKAQTLVVQTCGSLPVLYAATQTGRPTTIDVNGNLCVNATVSATATIAAFAPAGTNNALAVTSTTARTALTGAATNSTALVENTGAVDVFVAFGDGTVTVTAANGTRVPAGWAIAFNIGTGTNIAYITASSTSTINATTGTGLPALGAAGSGGGSSAITTWAGGTLGAMANYGTSPGAVLVPGTNSFITNVPAVSQSGTWNVTNVSGTVSLPTGAATAANQSTEITALNSIVTNTAAGAGGTAASVPASAIYVGNRGQNAEQTAVTNGQLVGQAADLTGKPIVLPYANPESFLNGQITAAMTGTTTTAVTGMGAQGAGVRNYVTQCTFSNSHATVGTIILLQDGSGGTTIWQAPAAPAFGGSVVQFPTPIKTTANTGLFAQNVTTGSNTFVSCTGYKGI